MAKEKLQNIQDLGLWSISLEVRGVYLNHIWLLQILMEILKFGIIAFTL